jgi:hypothetical protein
MRTSSGDDGQKQSGVASWEWEERTLFSPHSFDLTTSVSHQSADRLLTFPVGFWLLSGELLVALFRSGVVYEYVVITKV